MNVRHSKEGAESEDWQSLCAGTSLAQTPFWRTLVLIMSQPPSQKPTTGATLWSEVRAVLDLVLDFSFQRFVTPHLIRVLYALSLLAATLAAISWMFSGFFGEKGGLFYGMFTLITGPVAFVMYVLTARVIMEVILAIFQIAEKVRKD